MSRTFTLAFMPSLQPAPAADDEGEEYLFGCCPFCKNRDDGLICEMCEAADLFRVDPSVEPDEDDDE